MTPPEQTMQVTDEENEQFSRDVSNFKGADPEATKYALEEFLKNRALTQPAVPTGHEQCTGCEGKPINTNNPCAVCGKSQPAKQEFVGSINIWFHKGFGNYDFDYLGSLGEGTYSLYTTPPQLQEPEDEPIGEPAYYAHRIERSLDDSPEEYVTLHRTFLKDAAQTIRSLIK